MANKSTNSNLGLVTKESLAEMLHRKNELDNQLKILEKQIYNFEGNYIEDTCNYGNIIRGWDRYLSPSNKLTQHYSDKRNKRNASNDYRLFTRSSVTADNIGKNVSSDEEIISSGSRDAESIQNDDNLNNSKMAKVTTKKKFMAKRPKHRGSLDE